MNKKTSFLYLVALSLLFASCIKQDVKDLTNEGNTIVKILDGGTPATLVKKPVDFIPVPTQLLAADIRRDPNDNAALNRTMTVIVRDDTAAVKAANPAYIHLPSAWYTIQSDGPKTGGMGGVFTFTFGPGDFAKQIYITLTDPTLMNPSSLYGLGFTITSVDADGQIANAKSVVVEIGAKNDWDGTYAVRGPVVDVVTPNLIEWANQPGYSDPWLDAHPGAWEAHLITISGTDCIVHDNTIWGCPGLPLYNTSGGANTGYGGVGMIFTFDPATNTVVRVRNYYGDPTAGPATALGNPASGSGPPLYAASNTRRLEIDPTGQNVVQGNRNILVKFLMYHPAVAPGVRTTADLEFEYIGSR